MANKYVIKIEVPFGYFRDAKAAFEKQYTEAILTECRGDMTLSAELAGKERKDFYHLVKRVGLDPEDFRG